VVAKVAKDESPLARQTAEDFLILAGPELVHDKVDPYTSKKFQKDLVDRQHTWYAFKAWSITSQSMNPSQTEATVRGILQATKQVVGKRGGFSSGDISDMIGFQLKLVKDQGKWLVDSIEFGAAPIEDRKERP
jgi:hypothetical protein